MKVTPEQLNDEINEQLLPYLMEKSLPLMIVMKCVHVYVQERVDNYEWEDTEKAMEAVQFEIDEFLKPPTFEERFGYICLN